MMKGPHIFEEASSYNRQADCSTAPSEPSISACPRSRRPSHRARTQLSTTVPHVSRSFLLLSSLVASFLACDTAPVGSPSIAIVDEKAFHLEVVGGLMQVLAPYATSTTVYLHPLNFPDRSFDYGFMELARTFKAQLRGLPVLSMPHFDVVIFVSPEYRIDYVREFIDKSRPKAVVAMIHNGDAEGVIHMPRLHPNVHLVALSPHVAKFAVARLQRPVDVMLPLIGLTPEMPCTDSGQLHTCLSGFAIQGNMDSRRRNYTMIWGQLEERLNASAALRADPRFLINVVGSGSPKKLEVPERLELRVRPHVNLRFNDFYNLIYHNYALIPTLASEAYYDRKFSSTIITSLVTGTPVIVSHRFLKSYTFLTADHVFMQWNEEATLDAALRVLRLSSAEVAAIRKNVGQLREQLNRNASSQLKQIIDAAMTKKDLGTLPAVAGAR